MARLFVANCTKQRHEFTYFVPEDRRGSLKKIMIPIGGQVMVHKEDTPEVLNEIIDQHIRYGLVAAKDIPKTRAFIGVCYSINQMIDVDDIMTAAEHNDDVLIERGLHQRKTATLAMDAEMSKSVGEAGGTLEVLEVNIREDTKGKPESERASQSISVEKPERNDYGRNNRRRR
jgi:hypothetical protein